MKTTVIASALAMFLFVALPAAPALALTCIGAHACSNGSYNMNMRGQNKYAQKPQYYSKPQQQYQYYQPYVPSYTYQTYSYSYPQYAYYQPAQYQSYSYSNSWQSSSWYDYSYDYGYYDQYWY